MEFDGREQLIKKVQQALGLKVDGADGKITWTAIANHIEGACVDVVETPIVTDSVISDKALDLILEFEVGGGEAYYNKALKNPTWPGGASGVTIGVGYDLGYNTLSQFTEDWGTLLPSTDFDKLKKCLGVKGSAAKDLISGVKSVTVPWTSSLHVFKNSTLKRFINETKRVFPGVEKLHPDAFGALVSLVFNRGSSVSGSTRVEMLNISNAFKGVTKVDNIYKYIALQVRNMKRLWVGKNLDGLLRRRDAEAKLIENCS